MYRRILKISWTEHVTNNKVIRRVSKELDIVETIKARKLQYLGHVIWGEKHHIILQLIIQGKRQKKFRKEKNFMAAQLARMV